MTSSDRELRVLSGLHRGATVKLDSAATSLRIGRDAQNDVILRDASFNSVTLAIDPQGLLWNAEGDPVQMSVGQGIRMGALALLLSTADSPWAEDPEGGWAVDQPPDPMPDPVAPQQVKGIAGGTPQELQDSPRQGDGVVPETGDILVDPDIKPLSGSAIDGPLAVRAPRGRWITGLAWGGALAAAIGLVGLIMWGFEVMSPTDDELGLRGPAAAASTPQETQGVDPALLARVKKAIDGMALAGSVQVLPFAGGRVQLLGVTESDEKTEAIVRAAAAVTASLKLSLVTQAEFAQRVKSLASSLPSGVQVATEPVGRLVVNGTVDNEAVEEQLKALLSEEFPGASKTVMNVLTSQQRAEKEARELAARTPKAPTIAAVVSGVRPYVILPGGQKVQPGGLVQDLRLSSIEPDHLVFEDRAGARFKMPR